MHVQLVVLLLVLADPLGAETEAEAPLAEDRQVSTE
jgi:hypothetical protein